MKMTQFRSMLLVMAAAASLATPSAVQDECFAESGAITKKMMGGEAERMRSAENFGSLDIGGRSQVFVDRLLVRSAEGVSFHLIPARKHPVGRWLSHEKDREAPAGPMVMYDEEEKLFKSWSSASYNTSKDGLTWRAPERNDDSWRYIVRVTVIKDPKDPDPARRYKLITFGPSRDFPPGLNDADPVTNPDGSQTIFWYCKGYNTYTSPDGRRLTHLSRNSILVTPEGKSPGDVISGYYDGRHGLFVAFLKTPAQVETKLASGSRRAFSVMTSKDFQAWSGPNLVFTPDETDDAGALARIDRVRPLLLQPTDPKRLRTDIYGVGGPIQLESCVIVLLRVYTMHNSGDGPSEIQMAVSRDLKQWERPFRSPIIPRGKVGADPETSEWDTCWFNNEGPAVTVGDEIWVYYSARNTPHDHPVGFRREAFPADVRNEARKHIGTKYRSGIGIAVWNRDRFVAADAPASGGVLTTPPVVFAGNRLELNAATKPGGGIIVEILDRMGTVLGRSKRFSGDDLRHRVEWEAPLDLAGLAGEPVSLRFRMRSAELYAFAFRK